MTDREILELAAKAAGIKHDGVGYVSPTGLPMNWNPITDDGDALRLAVRLDFSIEQNIAFHRSCVLASIPGQKSVFATEFFEPWANDKQAATRRAIVRAAAEIGRAMP